MAKNMIRKALALGTGIALASVGLVAAPASAAGEVSLNVSAGTGTTTILGESFTLKATVGAAIPDNSNSQLRFLVANASLATMTVTADGGSGTGNAGADVEATQVVGDANNFAASDSSAAASFVVQPTFAVAARNAAGVGDSEDNQTLALVSGAAAGHSVTVTAWLDSDASGTINNGEFASAPVTISFVKAADAGISVSGSGYQLGDGNFTANITSSVVNLQQVNAGHFGVQSGIYVGGTKTAIINTGYVYGTLAAAAIDGAGSGDAVALNAGKTALTATDAVSFNDGAAQVALTAGTYVVQAIYSVNPGVAAWAKIGDEASFGIGAATANAANSSEAVTAVAGSVNADGTVIKGYTGNVTYAVTVKDADKAVLAGKVVRLTVGAVAGTWTVNGVAVAADDFEATTDANGVATFAFATSTAAAANSVTIGAIKSEGVTLVANGTDLAVAASTWTAVETTNGATDQTADLVRSTDSGTSTVVSFKVTDQFGNVFSDAAYRMKATLTGRTVGSLVDSLSDGVASFVVSDGAQTNGDTTVALSYEKLAAGVWGANADITALNDRTIKYYAQTNAVAVTQTTVTARAALAAAKAGDTRQGLTATAFVTGVGDKAADANNVDNSEEKATISGTVKHATTLAAAAGALVTVSGDSSILFNVNDVWAFGSLTFFDADGSFSIDAYSNKAQTDSVVTVTSSEGGSDTVKLTFNGVSTAAGSSLVINAADYISAGSTMIMSATLTDKYGNAVNTSLAAGVDYNEDNDLTDAGETSTDFKVTVSGPGLTLASLPTTTDDNGVATFNRLIGSNDSGTISITVSYDQNDDGDFLDATDLVVTKTVTIGTAPAADTKVNAGSFKGYVAIYAKGHMGKRLSAKVGKDWVVVPALASNFVRVVEYTGAGYTINVRIYIDRVLVDTIVVTTK